MVLVVVTAALFAALFLLFRYFGEKGIPLFPAIVVNYLTAAIAGILFSRPWDAGDLSLLPAPALLQGALFIGIFLLMGRSSQSMGVAITTVASKMSMVLTVLAMVLFFREVPGAAGWAGIALATVGVVLTSVPDRSTPRGSWWMPVVILVGSALGDIMIALVQRTRLTPYTEPVYPALVFTASACIGLAILLSGAQRTAILRRDVIIGGMVLGLINYGSIYCMVLALSTSGIPSSTVFPLLNIGTILIGTGASMLLFRERLALRPAIGIGLCLIASVFLLFDRT